ncbi:MAG: hypothetical protein PHZ19_07980 [Candidatus Thermoplasmatota archaeon]|nr:hypothetical protein [Candidatus Thermoplasmatota archaeon]
MKPVRISYLIIGRTSTDLPVPVLVFRTALDLHRIPGLVPRLKQAMGGKVIRPLARRPHV